jgi:8-oxo-dGTP pyrophosphatase MutT (NUDIX family)
MIKLEAVVWGILIKDDAVLLLQTPHNNNEWALVGGNVEAGESLKQALVRELKEEVGITASQDDLIFQCTIDRARDNGERKLHFFFKVESWNGDPHNKELHIHSAVEWHPLDLLPSTLGPLASRAIRSLISGETYFEYGP